MRAALGLLAALFAAGAAAEPVAVQVTNESRPTLCAEEDNVDLRLASDRVRRFRVEAVHPAYIGTLLVDRYAPDFTNCTITDRDDFSFTPRRVTLFETAELQIVGHTFPKFWRNRSVPVSVGARTEPDIHLIQVWLRHQERAEEVLVLYPGDGYWRARPLPPAHLRWSAYGSSFLIGPVEVAGRPIVDLNAVRFDPVARRFDLDFARGGGASVTLTSVDAERIAVDVAFDRPIAGPLPFAALRSMFVTEVNADVAHVGWRPPDAPGWTTRPVMAFEAASTLELWAGRMLPSRHNTSAPDMNFSGFSGVQLQ